MTIDQALYEEVSDDAGITAIVGTKVYPGIPPQTAKAPFISFREIAFQRSETLTGVTNLHNARAQIDCWGSTAEEMRSVSEALREALDGFSGPMGDIALNVRRCAYDGANDDPEKPPDGGDLDIHRKRVDFDIWYKI